MTSKARVCDLRHRPGPGRAIRGTRHWVRPRPTSPCRGRTGQPWAMARCGTVGVLDYYRGREQYRPC